MAVSTSRRRPTMTSRFSSSAFSSSPRWARPMLAINARNCSSDMCSYPVAITPSTGRRCGGRGPRGRQRRWSSRHLPQLGGLTLGVVSAEVQASEAHAAGGEREARETGGQGGERLSAVPPAEQEIVTVLAEQHGYGSTGAGFDLPGALLIG